MIDRAGCLSTASSELLTAQSQTRRDLQASDSITAESASPSVSVAPESFLAITKTNNVTTSTFTEPPITVTSTQPPSTVTIFVSQIATFTTFNATNTTIPTQSPLTATRVCYRAGTSISINCTTLMVVTATATPPAPSQPALTTTKKSAGSRSAQNPVAQLVKYFKSQLGGSNSKRPTSGGDNNYGLAFWFNSICE